MAALQAPEAGPEAATVVNEAANREDQAGRGNQERGAHFSRWASTGRIHLTPTTPEQKKSRIPRSRKLS